MEEQLLKKFQTIGLISPTTLSTRLADRMSAESSRESSTNVNKSKPPTHLLASSKTNIRDFIQEKRAPLLEEDDQIEQLDAEFRKYMEGDPDQFDKFLKYMVQMKFQIVQERAQCETFMREIETQKRILPNIFYHDDFAFRAQSNQIRLMTKVIKSDFFENQKKQSAIQYAAANTCYYHNLNVDAPSIGNIFLSNQTTPVSISAMIYGLCNGVSDILSLIPLHQQNIKDDIAALVIRKDESESNRTMNSTYKKRIISSVLNSVEITYDMIMKDKGKIRKTFIIPYRKEEYTDENGMYVHKFVYDKYIVLTSSRDVIKANNELLGKVLDLIKENPKYLNDAYVKDILALYVYFAIQLFYETYYLYFSKLSAILYEFQEDTRFAQNSLDVGSSYIEKCMDSLKMFKKILLNNFYDFFLPSRATRAYGIKIDEHGYVVCGSKLAVDNEFLMKKYPFMEMNLMAINHFIVGKRREGDLYDPNERLYIGFYLPNDRKMKDLMLFYKHYVRVLLAQYTFDIYICNLLSKKLYNGVPMEIFEKSMRQLTRLEENANVGDKMKNQLVILYYKYLTKSYQLLKTSKNKKYNKEKIQDMKAKEEVVLLSHFYYQCAEIIRTLVEQNSRIPSKVRTYIIDHMKRAFKKVESKL